MATIETLDVLQELKGLSPDDTEYLDDNDGSITSVIQYEPLNNCQSPETQSTTLLASKVENSTENKQRKKLNNQVSWGDKKDRNSESSGSGDESSQEDENEKFSNICDKCTLEFECCNCDSGVALDEQCMKKEKDSTTEDQAKAKEKDVEPGKFDGVFSDTDDSEGSGER